MSANLTDPSVSQALVPTGPDDMLSALVRAIAYMRVLGEEEVLEEVAVGGGDFVIESKDAVVVIPLAEKEFGGDRLVEVSDLKRRELTSLRNVSDLMWRRWSERHSGSNT